MKDGEVSGAVYPRGFLNQCGSKIRTALVDLPFRADF
jgi:hypothetical protein